MLIKINRIFHNETDQENKPLVNKNGKPYTRCVIYADGKDGQEKKISGFGSENTKMWMPNDEVDVEITESNGYYNFKESGESILQRIKKIENELVSLKKIGTTNSLNAPVSDAESRNVSLSNNNTQINTEQSVVSQNIPNPGDPGYIDVDSIPF